MPEQDNSIENVASGQKMIIYAILINIIATVLQIAVHPALALLLLPAIVLAIVGLVNLSKGLGKSTGLIVLFVILMFIPLVSLITLLVLNGQATEALRTAGYKVGLMGASKP